MKIAYVLSLLLIFNAAPFTVSAAEEAGGAEKEEPAKKEVYILVTTTDNAGKESRSIKTAAELKELMNELKLEEKLHDKAMALAEKEWKKDEELGKKTFPRSAIDKKTVKEIKRSTNQDEVTKKLDDLDKRELEKETEKKEEAKRRPTNRPGQRPMPGGQDRSKDREAKQKVKDAARDKIGSAARQMYITAMEELKAGANKPAAEAEGKEAKEAK
jgi:hypothetical protein